ncbi:MAG TPA: DedA family protein [Usitatibacteraceae bacterium]
MEPFSALIDNYGYLAVFIGTLLEGETILILAGFAAQRGYLDLGAVMAVAFAGGFLGDQLLFFLGRHHGHRIVARFPAIAQRIASVDGLLRNYHAPLIFCIRFMYGLRIVGPIALGMGAVSAGKFFIFNMMGACVWAILIAGAGFLFGQTLELLLSDIKRYELLGMGLIVLAAAAIWLLYRGRRK